MVDPLSELEPPIVRRALKAFAQRFDELGYNEGRAALVADGSGSELEAAGWLYYEGLSGTYGEELLDAQVPLMVMNVLVKRHGFRWSVEPSTDSQRIAVTHPELEEPIDCKRLIEMGRASFVNDPELQAMSDAGAAIEGLGAVISEITNRQVDRNRREFGFN